MCKPDSVVLLAVQPAGETDTPSTWNINTPLRSTFDLSSILIMSSVLDPGTEANRILSPALNPTCAGVPPRPFVPPLASPVVH